jgi:hypothetical protein
MDEADVLASAFEVVVFENADTDAADCILLASIGAISAVSIAPLSSATLLVGDGALCDCGTSCFFVRKAAEFFAGVAPVCAFAETGGAAGEAIADIFAAKF